MEPFFKLLFSFLNGLAFGSFANVYFYRVPEGLSLVRPGSFCPGCRAPIAWYDNIPLLSYMILQGKCRHCSASISVQYPLVEALCGLLFLAVAFRFYRGPDPALIAFLFFAFLLFLAAGTDLITYFQMDRQYGIIPDPLVLTMAISGLAFAHWNPFLQGSWTHSLIGAAVGGGFMWMFRWGGGAVLKREAMGLGDVKLVAAFGLWLGWYGVFIALAAGSLLGSLVSLGLMAMKKVDRHSAVPFGPFLAAGALYALLAL